MKKILKRIIFFIVFITLFFLFLRVLLIDNERVHCAEVKDENMFIGEYLLSDKYVFRGVIPVESCLKKDEITDQSDGPEKGKVRWVMCFYGPDCDEAGLF